jgi:hypothetical protein
MGCCYKHKARTRLPFLSDSVSSFQIELSVGYKPCIAPNTRPGQSLQPSASVHLQRSMETTDPAMATIILAPKKQRRRPAVSCTLCRQRKIRCNRANPCSNCLRSRSGTCTYEPSNSSSTLHQVAGPHPGSRSQPESRNHSADTSSPSAATASGGAMGDSDPPRGSRPDRGIPTPSSEQFAQHTETVRLKLRVRQLESQLETATATTAETRTHTPASLESGSVSGVKTTSTRLGGTFHLHYKQDVLGTSENIVQSVSVVWTESLDCWECFSGE